MSRRRRWILAAVAAVALATSPFLYRAALNLWLMLTDLDEYVVPVRSSIFTFVPTVMNDGSGGWWIYGEDFSGYYWYAEGRPGDSLFISRRDARLCLGFAPTDHSTWCR